MAIVKMKFVSACSDREHLNAMLLRGVNSKMLSAVLAKDIVSEENKGQLMDEDNPYEGYLATLTNIAHSVSYEYNVKDSTIEYTKEEIEAFLTELSEAFGLNVDGGTVELSQDDEIALDALRALDFEKMHACRYLDFGFGRMPLENFAKLNLYQEESFVHHRLHTNQQYVWLVYVTSDSYAVETKKIFESLYFEEMNIPSFDVKKRVKDYQDKMDLVYSYCKKENELFHMYPYVAILQEKNVVSGFVMEEQLEDYKACFKDLPVDFRVKDPSDVPHLKCPTKLRNGWFARPFEMFVEMYSLPAYEDFDPTLFLAITYCILFGIMFSDMGQGLILLVAGLALEKKKGRLWGVVGRCGITSAILGFLFGSLFGYEDALNPIHEHLFHVREKLFDVMSNSNTMTLLIGAMMIGAVLILITMCMNIYNHYKHKDMGEVLFSQNGIAGLVFYSYLVCAVGVKMQGNGSLFTPLYVVPCVVVPIVCFLMKEPFTRVLEGKSLKPEVGWGNYFTENIFEVFEILLSFVTNSMSYLRVGGFVLSHAGMMLVVMTLANMVDGAGIAVVIFGNAFVMLLEGLIVGIQTLRLEYYEMFSRYYTGGGKAFEPVQADMFVA